MYKGRIFVSLASTAMVMLLAGCATDGKMQEEVAQARAMSLESKTAADRVAEDARAALAKAEEALTKAEEAARAADAAQACCDENKERVDRVFKKAMRK